MKEENLNKIHNEEFERKVVELTISDIRRLTEKYNEFIESYCPACQGDKHCFYYSNFGLNFVQCVNCGTVFLNPCPNEKIILEYLNNSEGLKYWRENMPESVVRNRKEKLYTDRISYISLQILKYNITMNKFIDIGGGRGEFIEQMQKMNLFFEKNIIIEPQPLSINITNTEVFNGTFEKYRSNEKADLITAFEVIEHIVNPDKFMENVRINLSDEGIFILSTPNVGGFETVTLKEKSHSCWFDHVRLYNTESLKLLLNRNGFEVIEITTPGELDVEIVHRIYLKNELDILNNYALKYLMEDGYKYKDEFQNYLVKNKLSSHIKCIAKKK